MQEIHRKHTWLTFNGTWLWYSSRRFFTKTSFLQGNVQCESKKSSPPPQNFLRYFHFWWTCV